MFTFFYRSATMQNVKKKSGEDLSAESKEARVMTRVTTLMRYQPDPELMSALSCTLLDFPKSFKEDRTIAHLGRICCASFFYKKRVLNACGCLPNQHHLFLKLLKTQLEQLGGGRSVLGIIVSFNQKFLEIDSLCHVISGVKFVEGSLIDRRDPQHRIQTIYFEIERDNNPEFSLEEVNHLQKVLPAMWQRLF